MQLFKELLNKFVYLEKAFEAQMKKYISSVEDLTPSQRTNFARVTAMFIGKFLIDSIVTLLRTTRTTQHNKNKIFIQTIQSVFSQMIKRLSYATNVFCNFVYNSLKIFVSIY